MPVLRIRVLLLSMPIRACSLLGTALTLLWLYLRPTYEGERDPSLPARHLDGPRLGRVVRPTRTHADRRGEAHRHAHGRRLRQLARRREGLDHGRRHAPHR